jgi:DNA-directed RNA polymerase subunit beta'
MRVSDLESIRIKLASPDDILNWSHGEVTKPETINYRTQKAEKDGLFCEKIFGPTKDYECYCGKYKRIRYKGVVCDRCGVEVTKSSVRRERMGHIKLACPVSHIWFLRGVPSRMGMILDVPMHQLEKVIYFANYIITKVDKEAKEKCLEEIEKEYKIKIKEQKGVYTDIAKMSVAEKTKLQSKLEDLKNAREKAKEEISKIKFLSIISEVEYYELSLKYGEIFVAGTGAEALKKIFEEIDLKKEIKSLKKEADEAIPANRKKIWRRLRTFKGMVKANIRPEWMFITVLPVLPPDLRPMVQLDGGRYASSDLNDLYRRVINRNNRLKYLLEIDAPEVIIRNEKRMLQEAVDSLIDNGMRKGVLTTATTGGRRFLKSLADILKGKQGRFRQNLLGKRVDYSGRSVIVVGPKLKLRQCGLPKKMALELFKPFVIKKILDRELVYNVRGASKLIEQQTDEVWEILEEVAKDKLVLLNRAPTLHHLGIQAFQPVLIEGESIRLHPMVCKAFNADFDGDQMAVHLPLSREAQKEAKEIMLSSLNLLKATTGTPIVLPTQDIVLGCYWMTKIPKQADIKNLGKNDSKDQEVENLKLGRKQKIMSSPEEALLAYDLGKIGLRELIKVRMIDFKTRTNESSDHKDKKLSNEASGFNDIIETSAGRILFNESLPEDYPFVNMSMNSKKIEKIVAKIISNYGQETAEETLDKIKTLGFENATLSGMTWAMDDLVVPKEKEEIVKKAEKEITKIEDHFRKGLLTRAEKTSTVIEVWTRTKSEIEKLVPKCLPKTGTVFAIIDSGARGSWVQPVQMAGMKGLVINPSGQIMELPVKSSFKEGFNVLEYFISTHGARKGTADTALRTSTAGYLTRRLVDVAHETIVMEEDCKDNEGLEIYREDSNKIGQNFLYKILGRTSVEDIKTEKITMAGDKELKSEEVVVKKGEIIDWVAAEKIIDSGIQKIRVRSPLTCKSVRGICQKCYGWDFGLNKLVKLGKAVGIIAAQSIGEPGTQLTLRTFHTGGVVGGADITQGLPRVQEVFEARIPGGKAEISNVEGKVVDITDDKIIRIRVKDKAGNISDAKMNIETKNRDKSKLARNKKEKEEIVEYKIPHKSAIFVSKGQDIKIGQQLCEGSLDLKEVFKIKGEEQAKRYILNEIQNIYVTQGAIIHDKHVEVITRQMFSRVKIKNPGDSSFGIDQVVEKAEFLEENAILKKENKEMAVSVPVLLGISRVALTTDSFLSSASFQQTSKVLIKAALEGKEDKLHGLKENVIIGKLVPCGTGFKK